MQNNPLRNADHIALEAALNEGRTALLQYLEVYRRSLGDDTLRVPCTLELNLPLWELGHLAWFEEYWIARNTQRALGIAADPEVPRRAPLLGDADTLYNSSQVAHAARWQLPLPDLTRTLAYLASVREITLSLLAEQSSLSDDNALYFFRLALFHEAMHREAWIYMAQTLGITLAIEGPCNTQQFSTELSFAGGMWKLGSETPGFSFDNELRAHAVEVAPFSIDPAPISWRRYLPFVEAGAYDTMRYWSAEGWAWRQRHDQPFPRYLRRKNMLWEQHYFGQWCTLALDLPAMHLTYHEAQAWCRWAERRLPSEIEWEMAACSTESKDFGWGAVWEWTASSFTPYPGFTAHPYRDYSAPWFGTHQVLRGASFATAAGIKHARYRNFFTPERNDIFAGFRSCAL